MCCLPAGNSRCGHLEGSFKWPQLHQSCWNRAEREGWSWSLLGQGAAKPRVHLEGKREAGACDAAHLETWDLHRATTCTSQPGLEQPPGAEIKWRGNETLSCEPESECFPFGRRGEDVGKGGDLISQTPVTPVTGTNGWAPTPQCLHASLATSFWVSKSHVEGHGQ